MQSLSIESQEKSTLGVEEDTIHLIEVTQEGPGA
jgi:hypothetical protein